MSVTEYEIEGGELRVVCPDEENTSGCPATGGLRYRVHNPNAEDVTAEAVVRAAVAARLGWNG
jgi:hypothetical protein